MLERELALRIKYFIHDKYITMLKGIRCSDWSPHPKFLNHSLFIKAFIIINFNSFVFSKCLKSFIIDTKVNFPH